MQRAEDSSTELIPGTDPPRTGLSPALAFLLLVLVVALMAAAVFFTRPEAQVQATASDRGSTTPNFALTNEEAIGRFKELSSLLTQAYAQRDQSLFDSFLATGSPLFQTGTNEIRRLLRDNVTPVPHIKWTSIQVRENGRNEIVLRSIEIDRSRFLSGNKDVTRQTRPIRRTVDWVLRLEGSEWLIYDSTVVRSEAIQP